jgi:hypothetical protein
MLQRKTNADKTVRMFDRFEWEPKTVADRSQSKNVFC